MGLIRIVDHTRSPGGRYQRDGNFSGEWFRDQILVPALRAAITAKEKLFVELDGTSGYGSSFLEEAFGGLIRLNLFSRTEIKEHLLVIAKDGLYMPYKRLAERYLSEARSPEMTAA